MATVTARRVLALKQPCRYCGYAGFHVLPGKGPHAGELRCAECGRHARWLSKRQAECFNAPPLGGGEPTTEEVPW